MATKRVAKKAKKASPPIPDYPPGIPDEKPRSPSEYELAAEKAIALNPKSAAYSASVAVIETLLKNALEVVAYLRTALANAKDGTGQDGGTATSAIVDPGPRPKE